MQQPAKRFQPERRISLLSVLNHHQGVTWSLRIEPEFPRDVSSSRSSSGSSPFDDASTFGDEVLLKQAGGMAKVTNCSFHGFETLGCEITDMPMI
jgi:hypothetical protein